MNNISFQIDWATRNHLFSGCLITVAVGLLLITTFSCTNKKADFTVDTPKGWIRVDTVSTNTAEKEVRFYHKEITSIPDFYSSIRISIVHFFSLDIYMSQVLTRFKNQAKIFEDLGSGAIELNGHTFKWIRHNLQSKDEYFFLSKRLFIQKTTAIFI
jgi:DNA recombination-dependent growth factor C